MFTAGADSAYLAILWGDRRREYRRDGSAGSGGRRTMWTTIRRVSRVGDETRGARSRPTGSSEATLARHEIEDQIAEGDKVVTRLTAYGSTRASGLVRYRPTRPEVRETAVAIHRIADGGIVEHSSDKDDLALMQQLGVISLRPPVDRPVSRIAASRDEPAFALACGARSASDDDEQEHSSRVLLLDDCGSGTGADRVASGISLSSTAVHGYLRRCRNHAQRRSESRCASSSAAGPVPAPSSSIRPVLGMAFSLRAFPSSGSR
jgi:hypothetical protein